MEKGNTAVTAKLSSLHYQIQKPGVPVARWWKEVKVKETNMGYELVGTPKSQKMTQAIAIKFRDMDPVPHDRALNPKRVDAYRKMLKEGLFRPVQWATVHCNETQCTYRVNGKHTSNLFAEYEELPQEVHVTIEHYHCDTLDDVARLYGTFDSKAQLRTAADINRAFAAVDEDLRELPSRLVNICVSSIAYAYHGEKVSHLSATEKAEAILDDENKQFVAWVHDIIGNKNEATRHLWRSAVVSAMYLSYRKSRRDANEFWLAVRDGTGMSNKSPDRVLQRFLLSRGISPWGGEKTRRTTQVVGAREMFVRCIHAWNAWRRDTTTDLKYHAQAKIPAAV